MTRFRMMALMLTVLLAAPLAAFAHEGHTHKVMGTVASVQGTRVDVKSTDGKLVTVVLDAKTTVTRGKTKLDAGAVVPGGRVSIDYVPQKDVNVARAVKLAEAPAAAQAK